MSNKGVGLLAVEVWCDEVRLTTAPAFTQTKSPASADPSNGGTVQTISEDRLTRAGIAPPPSALSSILGQ
jgi:hypothetical protein